MDTRAREGIFKSQPRRKRITEITHFKKEKKLRIICDGSKQGLGAVLQQQQSNRERKQASFASRFSTDSESKYSINELELLAVVWAIERFKTYVYGVKFQVISDHKALASVLKPNRSNKTFSSRLTRWVDRLLPFEIEIIHAPGRVLGFADYLSSHPSEIKRNAGNSEKLRNDWFTVNAISKINAISENETTPLEMPKSMKLPRAPDSVLKVESEQDAQQAEKANERNGNQPIKSRESYARRNFSAVQNLSKVSERENSKSCFFTRQKLLTKSTIRFYSQTMKPTKCFKK